MMSNSRYKSRGLKIEEHVEFKKLLNSSDSNAIAIWDLFSKTRNEDDFNRSVIEILNLTKIKQVEKTVTPIKQSSPSPTPIVLKQPSASTTSNNGNKSKSSNSTDVSSTKSKHVHDKPNEKPQNNKPNEKPQNNKPNEKSRDNKHKKSSEEERDNGKSMEETIVNKEIDDNKGTTTSSLDSLTQLLKSTMISSPSIVKENLSPALDIIKSDNISIEKTEVVGGMSFGLWNSIDNSLKNVERIDSEISNSHSSRSGQGLGFSFNSLGRGNQDDQLIGSKKSLDHWDVAQELMGNLTAQRPDREMQDNETHPFAINSLGTHSTHGFPMHQPPPFPPHPASLGNPMFFPPMGMQHPLDNRMMLPSHHGPPSGHSPFHGGALYPPPPPMHPQMFPPPPPLSYSQFPHMHPGPNDFNMPPFQNYPPREHREHPGNLGNTETRSVRYIGGPEVVDRDPLESFKFEDKKVIELNPNSFSRDEDFISKLTTDKPKEPEPVSIPEKSIAPKGPQFRTTRNRCARLSISMNQQGRRDQDIICTENNNAVRPGWHMTVHWEMPLSELKKSETDYVIALLRLGSPTNSSSIVSKHVESNSKTTTVGIDNNGVQVVKGKIPFHAPKSAGIFVYRLFDQATKDKIFVTLGTSMAFKVDLLDLDVTTSLKFCVDLFQEKSHQRAISQLRTTVVGMRNSGRHINGENPNSILSKCVDYMIEVSIQAMQSLEAAKSKVSNDKETEGAEKKQDDEAWVTVKQAGKLQKDIYDTFCSIQYNEISWSMLGEIYQLRILRTQELFCPLVGRYFFTPQARDECRQSEFNFIPAPCTSRNQLQEKLSLAYLEKAIHDILPSLLPSPDFHIRRENARMRVQKAICSSGVVPENTELVLYGSSRNNFGTDSADLDMCMIFPPNVNIAIIDRPALIERLAEILGKIGMTEVSSRATARIPIVQFKDPQTGFDCDISFNNPLAVANTKLLKAYSEIDSRVLPLAFVIKHWAKARLINNPGEGTLSSYGYILCLIHFLQHRPVPVLPNLQQLPPDWDGNPNFKKEYPHARWQRTTENHPVEGTPCDTYFYSSPRGKDLLKNFASRNKESTAELLAAFFQYFAWEFDYRRNIVQIQSADATDKLSKAETDCWNQHDRISIEDPFEIWYDVAHVVKSAPMFYIRKEFLRAHTLISRCAKIGPFDTLPSSVDPQALLGKVCERAEEREKPVTTTTTENENEDDI